MQSPDREIAKTKELVDTFISEDFPDLNSGELEKELSGKVSYWAESTLSYLENSNPFEKHRSKLVSAEWDFRAHGGCKESIMNDLEGYKSLQPSADVMFWEERALDAKKELEEEKREEEKREEEKKEGEKREGEKREGEKKEEKKLDEEKKDEEKKEEKKKEPIIENLDAESLNAIRRNEQEAWRKEYEKQLLEWQLREIQDRREQLLKELNEWLEPLQQMKEVFDELGIEPGLLWDSSTGKLCTQDISFLKQWAEYLKNNESVRNLCELMGRLSKEQQSHRTELINSTVQYSVIKPDIHSNEEIVGIKLGRDLDNVIPQELALLSDPDIALLFDLKYVENRLMCFSKQGDETEIVEEEIQKTVSVVDDEKMGPIIICVDTSRSMSGAPENIAKALTLSLSSRAVSQKRKCYLINFSTAIETLDLTPPKGIQDLIDFLKMSFHGGTNAAPALHEGVRMMSEADYKKADLLVISDFSLYGLSSDIVSRCKKQKQEGNRFFSLSIGSFGTQRVDGAVFDRNWTYDPLSGGISEINNVVERVARK